MHLRLLKWIVRLVVFLMFSDELKHLRPEREELEKETEQWKTEQTKEWNKERQQHKYVLLLKMGQFSV